MRWPAEEGLIAGAYAVLCATLPHMPRNHVGVRALQQNASEVVKRAAAGEIIDITDRGRLVARMVPAHLR